MDVIKLSVELDKIVNDLLHITMGVTFNDIYTKLHEHKIAEKSEKIVADDIYELQKNMDYYYEDLRNFDRKPRKDWNNILEKLMETREKALKGVTFLQHPSNSTKDKYYKIRWNYLLTTFKTVVNDSLEIVRNTLAADHKFCEMYQRLGIDYIEKFKLQDI
jgi:hypothetical protein